MGQLTPLVEKIEAAYRRLGAAGERVLLAVSGGVDSTALLLATARLADRLGIRAEVACVDHGLRPESEEEASRVGELARAYAMPFHLRQLRLSSGSSLEERAREARYAALSTLREERGLSLIATAHTASDQAETVLMRLARGAALRGAAAILPRRGTIIRPMIEVTRDEVERFLAREGSRPARDPMNQDRSFARARVRLDALPALESALGPGVSRNLAHFAQLAAEDETLLSELAEADFARLSTGQGGLEATGVRGLQLPLRRRVLARLVEVSGSAVDCGLIERALSAVERGGTATLRRGLLLKSQGGVVRCVPSRPPLQPAEELRLRPGGEVEDPRAGLVLRLDRACPGSSVASIGLGEVELPLTVRHRRPGDRIGSRKLQDLLVNLKVRAEDRDLVPLVCDRLGRVVWVVGLWPRRRPSSTALYLSARPTPDGRAHEWLFRYRLAGQVAGQPPSNS